MFNKKNVTTVTLASLASLFIATTASADINVSPYLGGSLGWGSIDAPKINIDGVENNNTNGGFAGRVYGGISFTQNLALEEGYTKFSDVTYKYSNEGFNVNAKIESYALDVVGKLTIPLVNNFSVFGKLGGAYLDEAASVTVEGHGDSDSESASTSKFLPTFGAGLGYNINKDVSADVSWMRIQKVGDTSLKSTDTAMFGLSYHF